MNLYDTTARRDLSALFEPESVAVVGASDDPVKWGNWLARGAQPSGSVKQLVKAYSKSGGAEVDPSTTKPATARSEVPVAEPDTPTAEPEDPAADAEDTADQVEGEAP